MNENSEFKTPKLPVIVPPVITTTLEDVKDGDSGEPSSSNPTLKPLGGSSLGSELKQIVPGTLNDKKTTDLVRPGKSMVAWMRHQSKLDTSHRPPLRKIALEEIRLHAIETNVWMALRGKVYDVTEYVKFHPGGVSEIMKGAGKDATSLFDSIHRWVNFESILRNQHIGFLSQDSSDLLHMLFPKSLKQRLSTNSLNQSVPSNSSRQLVPVTNFSQDDSNVYFQVIAQTPSLTCDEDWWTVGIFNRERLFIKVVTKPPEVWMAHLKLREALQDHATALDFENYFRKLVVTMKKPKNVKWKSIGAPLEENNLIVDSRSSEDMYPCSIIEKTIVTHNVYRFTIQVGGSNHIGVPIGFHVKLQINDFSKSYTPVCASTSLFEPRSEEQQETKGHLFYFLIKIYPKGEFTPLLQSIPIVPVTKTEEASSLQIGSSAGTFDVEFLQNVNTLLLIAGGTGLTPMIRIIQHLITKDKTVPCSVILMFFNHTEDDIIWKEEWETLEKQHSWFHFCPILTNPGINWTGLKGKISKKLISECLDCTVLAKGGNDSGERNLGRKKAIVCGSQGFNFACQRELLEMEGWDDIFQFGG